MERMAENLIEVQRLKQYFPISTGWFQTRPLKAVDGVSFHIRRGETLGLVGESGCGKTTVGRTLLHLYPPTSGQIIFDGKEVKNRQDIREFRKKASMVFQDPYSSLNPRMTVADLIAEPLDIHRLYENRQERRERVLALMAKVGLNAEHAGRYAHEFSGGQRQRIGIARALAMEPEFVVCDEPVSALDVSIQAQILNLLMDLQDQFGMSYLFITHDLSVVKHISHDIAVMYLGQCVESGSTEEIFKHPAHPYTKALLASIPTPSLATRDKEPQIIRGEVVSPINPAPGCRFAARCPYATDACREAQQEREIREGHFVMCCRAEELAE